MKKELLEIKKNLLEYVDKIDALLEQSDKSIEDIVCGKFLITLDELHSKTRKRDVVIARQIIMWHDIEIDKKSLKKAGARFDKDHATALYAHNVINDLATTDATFADLVHYIMVKTRNI